MKRLLAFLVACAVLVTLAACGGSQTPAQSETSQKTTSESQSSSQPQDSTVAESSGKYRFIDETQIEKTPLENTKVTILETDASWQPHQSLAEYIEARYGLTFNVVSAPWADFRNKLIAMVMSADSPDIVTPRRGGGFSVSDDFYIFANNDLIQPIDVVAETEVSKYPEALALVEETKYGGLNYILPVRKKYQGARVVYNTKLFKENALETPWELYEKGEWNWNTFTELSDALTQDTDMDGVIDIYGSVFLRPNVLVYTTGLPNGEVYQDETYKLNLKHPDMIRVMDFAYDLVFVKKVASNDYQNALKLFKEGKAAMLLDEGWAAVTPEAIELAKVDSLDCAPLPQDPEKDKLYALAYLLHICIPKGAKNVKGAIAYYNSLLYDEYITSENPALKEMYKQTTMEKYSWSSDMYDHSSAITDNKTPNMEPVYDPAMFIGYDAIWEFLFSSDGSKNWTTFVEERIPQIESDIKRNIFKKKNLEAITEAMKEKEQQQQQ